MIFQQVRYPINQKFVRGANNRYRHGSTGMLATFNQKSTNRFASKKKTKPKKEAKKCDDENVEVEKKTILKDERKDVAESR